MSWMGAVQSSFGLVLYEKKSPLYHARPGWLDLIFDRYWLIVSRRTLSVSAISCLLISWTAYIYAVIASFPSVTTSIGSSPRELSSERSYWSAKAV